ncbi:MAG: 50S ribosomal protein L18 [Chloroflexi bacterium]|nr:50S ribosomal protein L18 [Chloroflexota bacterium]
MAVKIRSPYDARLRRHRRIRHRVVGETQRPRLCVFRSLNHIYAQIVDDARGATLAAASARDPALRETAAGLPKTEVSKLVGALVAERARSQGITRVVFDRGGYRYHGRVRALAEAARAGGLEF